MSADNVIKKKAEAAAEIAADREGAFKDEREAEEHLCADIVSDVLPVLPMLCSRVVWGDALVYGEAASFRGLEIAPELYLDERGRFRMHVDGVPLVITPDMLPARYGRGSARLLAFSVARALDALVAGGSKARTDEARKLAEKYRAVSTLIRGGTT